jgi:hypothetical protein
VLAASTEEGREALVRAGAEQSHIYLCGAALNFLVIPVAIVQLVRGWRYMKPLPWLLLLEHVLVALVATCRVGQYMYSYFGLLEGDGMMLAVAAIGGMVLLQAAFSLLVFAWAALLMAGSPGVDPFRPLRVPFVVLNSSSVAVIATLFILLTSMPNSAKNISIVGDIYLALVSVVYATLFIYFGRALLGKLTSNIKSVKSWSRARSLMRVAYANCTLLMLNAALRVVVTGLGNTFFTVGVFGSLQALAILVDVACLISLLFTFKSSIDAQMKAKEPLKSGSSKQKHRQNKHHQNRLVAAAVRVSTTSHQGSKRGSGSVTSDFEAIKATSVTPDFDNALQNPVPVFVVAAPGQSQSPRQQALSPRQEARRTSTFLTSPRQHAGRMSSSNNLPSILESLPSKILD